MSVSLRNKRVAIYAHSDAGSGGYAEDRYTRQVSTALDGKWWASVTTATGREAAQGGQAQHAADVLLGFSTAAPISPDDVVQLDDGRLVKVTSPALPRTHGIDEQHVSALYVDDAQAATYVLVEP